MLPGAARLISLVMLASLIGCSLDAGDTAVGTSTGMGFDPAACEVPEQGLPDDVFCTGLYVAHDVTRYADDVMPYTPGVTLWSDGAEKQRFLYLPPGTAIDRGAGHARAGVAGRVLPEDLTVAVEDHVMHAGRHADRRRGCQGRPDRRSCRRSGIRRSGST